MCFQRDKLDVKGKERDSLQPWDTAEEIHWLTTNTTRQEVEKTSLDGKYKKSKLRKVIPLKMRINFTL